MQNDVWEVISRPTNRAVVGSRWIFKIKHVADGSNEKYKARFLGSLGLIEECKRDLAAEFKMKDLGLMHYFLGMELWQIDEEIFLGQRKYCIEILRRFGMEDCKAVSTPMITNWWKVDTSKEKDVDPTLYKQLIGSLMYLVNLMPDISYAVNSLS
eukprot:PITA_32203